MKRAATRIAAACALVACVAARPGGASAADAAPRAAVHTAPRAAVDAAAENAPSAALDAMAGAEAEARRSDPWLDRVRSFEPGSASGFGADALPRIVLGPPRGLGQQQGSTDVVSLGVDGRIVVAFDDNAVVDGPGDDLVIFENAFYSGEFLFDEVAFVEVSSDGRDWHAFAWEDDRSGLAGQVPVLSSPSNGLDPLDADSGGDRFDLADVGLDFVRFVRLTDAGALVPDGGDLSFPGNKGGFDLDAAAAIHSTPLGCVAGRVLAEGKVVAGARVRLLAEGQPRRRRLTHADGSFRFCRLRPEVQYALAALHEELGRAEAPAWLDAGSLRAEADLHLE